jgi:membrane protein implicated in regulation of membrane protease activity
MDWIGDHLWQAWLALAIVLGVAEMFSLDLILAMLAMGALVAMVVALAGLSLPFQVLAALATSVAMLALVRPSFVKRLHGGPDLALGHGKLVGTQGVVTAEITGLAPGRVHVGGETWTALPYDETLRIAEGETVEVLQIKGATAYVHPVARLES